MPSLPAPDQPFVHLDAVEHEGKPVVVASDRAGRLHYTVRRSGFEQSEAPTSDAAHWEPFRPLPLPGAERPDPPDPSIVAREEREFRLRARGGDETIPAYSHRSRFGTHAQGRPERVRLVSHGSVLHVFRQLVGAGRGEPSNVLVVDRFVLDGLSNRLNLKLDVRFRRSRRKFEPDRNADGSSTDSLDFRDANERPFLEPSTELSFLGEDVAAGLWDVAIVAGTEHDRYRWHLAWVEASTGALRLASVASTPERLFDLRDRRGVAGFAVTGIDVGERIVTAHPALARFDKQRAIEGEDGETRLVRMSTHLMCTVPLAPATRSGDGAGTLALELDLAADGTLASDANLAPSGAPEVLRADHEDIALPLDTIGDIRGVGLEHPLTVGEVTSIRRDTADTVRVEYRAPDDAAMHADAPVRLDGAASLDGRFRVRGIVVGRLSKALDREHRTLQLDANLADPLPPGLGLRLLGPRGRVLGRVTTADHRWRTRRRSVSILEAGFDAPVGSRVECVDAFEIETERTLGRLLELPTADATDRFAGQVSGVDRLGGGRLRVHAFDHGLADGAEVRLDGLPGLDGRFEVFHGEEHVLLGARWPEATAIDLEAVRGARRGLVLERGARASLPVSPEHDLGGRGEMTLELRLRASGACQLLEQTPIALELEADGALVLRYDGQRTLFRAEAPALVDGRWHHLALTRTSTAGYRLLVDGHDVALDTRGWGAQAVRLEEAGESKIAAIRAVRELLRIGLREAKELVESAPVTLLEHVDEPRVEAVRALFAAMAPGARLGVRGAPPRGTDFLIGDVGDDRAGVLRAIADAFGQGPADAARRRSLDGAFLTALDDARADDFRKALEAVGATVELWRDGVRVHRSVNPRSVVPTRLGLGGRGRPLTLADLRLWSRALEAGEIDARQHLPLNGRELGLVGLWRLGAILEGERRELVDHTPQGRNGECGPGAWIESHRVAGTLGDGSPVVRFENAALVGVVSGASYEEIVELRVERDGKALTAEEAERALAARFEGRRSRHAETRIEHEAFDVHGASWTSAGAGGWLRLVTRVTVPGDVSLVRAFGLAVADGERVSALAVRRLRLRRVSGSISRVTRRTPPIDARPAEDVSTSELDKLHALEVEDVERRRRRRAIDADLALLGDVAALGRRVDAARRHLDAQRGDLRRVERELEAERRNPLNYWCYLILTGRPLRAYSKAHEEGVERHQILRSKPTNTSYRNFRWAYDWRTGKLHSGSPDRVMSMYGSAWDYQLFAVPGNTRTEQAWDVLPRGPANAPYAMIGLLNRRWQRQPIPHRQHGMAGGTFPRLPGGDPLVPFPIEVERRPQGQTPYSRIAPLETERRRLDRSVAAARDEHTRLRGLFDGHEARLRELTAERERVDRRLGIIEDELRKLHATLDGARRDSATEQGESVVPGLRAHELGGVAPHGSYALADRADGALVLSALDARGALSETRYEAAATASTFERWRRRRFRDCADLGATGAVRLEPPVGGRGADATLELWVRLPWVGNDGARTVLAATSAGELLTSENDVPSFRISLSGTDEPLFETDWPEPGWHHLGLVVSGAGPRATTRLYVDGVLQDDARAAAEARTAALIEQAPDEEAKRALREAFENGSYRPDGAFAVVANRPGGNDGVGLLAELRVWNFALSDEEMEVNSRVLLSGREPGLVHYLPLDADGASRTTNSEARLVRVRTRRETDIGFADVRRPWSARPGRLVDGALGSDAVGGVVAVEYASTRIDAVSGRRGAMMRRLYTGVVDGRMALLAHQRVESLEMVWVGNAQFAPTLLGYIEGAPPVPTENLTMDVGVKSYSGATSVQLTATSEVDFNWQRDQKAGLGLDMSVFFGRAGKIFVFPGTEVGQYKAGFRGDLSLGYSFLNSSEVTASSGLSLTDRLELRGSLEIEPRFPQLGRRFVPKNIGYALVVSSVADVYVTRLPLTGTMVSYEVVPSPEIPPDVNTITFLINPAYTMAGSLDGLTGTRATSERFFAHVPALRAQLGSRYPASYMRVDEAYALKARIERDDREREAFFANFDSRLVDQGSLNREVDGDIDENELEADSERRRRELERQGEQSEDKADAAAGLAAWQTKMEQLSLSAGKRDILNTYVWDADGGLRSESQDFADTVTHTIGGSFSLSGRLGFEGEGDFLGVAAGLTALATVHLEQTMTRSRTARRAMTLDVDLSGVESRGITDHRDRPLQPGEKVDRYRFMSFYLAGATEHFDTFFDEVVDPEWLASNDEEARALRQVDRSRANKCWRVMHRVTYVERPALLDLGTDVRPLSGPPAEPATTLDDVTVRLDTLDRSVRSLQRSVKRLGETTSDEE